MYIIQISQSMLDKGFTDFIPPKYYVHQLLGNDVVTIIMQ